MHWTQSGEKTQFGRRTALDRTSEGIATRVSHFGMLQSFQVAKEKRKESMESERLRRWGGEVISWLRAEGLEFNSPSHPNRLSNERPSPTARRPLSIIPPVSLSQHWKIIL